MKEEQAGAVDAVAVAQNFPAISLEAYAWYNNPIALGGIRPRGLLPLVLAYDIAQAVGRSLSQADLEFLVQKDGEPILCDGCGKQFQPVKWAVVNEKIIATLKSGVEFGQLNGEVRWAGSRIVKVGEKGIPRILSFCGAFWFYDPQRRDEVTGAEFFSINRRTCLGAAYHHDENCDEQGKPRPLRAVKSAQELIEKMSENHEMRIAEIRQERAERQQKVISGVSFAFSKTRERQPGPKTRGINGGPRDGRRR